MPEYYKGAEYRQLVGEDPDVASFFTLHDTEQLARYRLLERTPLRGRVVADIGCAGGSFLDGVRGFASTTIGIEPATAYHASLRDRGHLVFTNVSEACNRWSGKVNVAVCFSVIEHVVQPTMFLSQIRELLAPDGQLLISTPNSNDILLHVGCEAYEQFFFRSVHTYYFDRDALKTAAIAAGFKEFDAFFIHRFNFGNFIGWLAQQRPFSNAHASPLGARFDRLWRTELEETGRSDYLYAWLAL